MTDADKTARIAEIRSDLVLVRNARRAILTGGQEYTAENRQKRQADLNALRDEERALQNELARLSGTAASRTYGVVYP